jgi:hypothetical protein
VDYNVAYTDPGQPNRVIYNGHPNTYGFGFTIITAFVPEPPPAGTMARSIAAAGTSFTVHYDPIFAGNFTLYAKRFGVVLYQRLLGWRTVGQHAAWFDCGTRRGRLALVVAGKRQGRTQQSQVKRVYC